MDGGLTVNVPDAECGYVLTRRIGNGARVVPEGDGGSDRWVVAVDGMDGLEGNDKLSETLAVIEQWLRDERITAVDVELDGRTYQMICT